jgi:hypothetical protein
MPWLFGAAVWSNCLRTPRLPRPRDSVLSGKGRCFSARTGREAFLFLQPCSKHPLFGPLRLQAESDLDERPAGVCIQTFGSISADAGRWCTACVSMRRRVEGGQVRHRRRLLPRPSVPERTLLCRWRVPRPQTMSRRSKGRSECKARSSGLVPSRSQNKIICNRRSPSKDL